jgi:hypothetical protein
LPAAADSRVGTTCEKTPERRSPLISIFEFVRKKKRRLGFSFFVSVRKRLQLIWVGTGDVAAAARGNHSYSA